MCMFVNGRKTAELKALEPDGEIYAWKVLLVEKRNGKISLYSTTYPDGQSWLPGVRESDRESAELSPRESGPGYKFVEHGIHVSLSTEAARKWLGMNCVIVRVRCVLFDLVAAGGELKGQYLSQVYTSAEDEAVFMKVTLSDEDYASALNAACKLPSILEYI